MAENRNQDQEVSHVTIKAPAFIDTNPSAYFSIIEAQFHLKNITMSSTKFYNVISSMPPDVVGRLSPTILAAADYDSLKDAVKSIYEKTKPEILNKLMKDHSISGRPSLYLNEMVTLAGKIELGDDIVRHKFIRALPPSISAIIASQKALNLTQLGELADELMPHFNQQTANAVQSDQFLPPPTTNAVQNNSHFQSYSYKGPSTNSGRQYYSHCNNKRRDTYSNNNSDQMSSLPPGMRPYSANQRPVVCRAHLYYGPKARTCKPWCRWPSKDGCNILPNSRPASPSRQPDLN